MRTIEMILNNDKPGETQIRETRAARPLWPSQHATQRHSLFRISRGSCISWLSGLSGYGSVLVAALVLVVGSPASAVPLFQLKPRVTAAEKARLARQAQEATNAVVQLAGPQPPITLPPAANATDNPLANFWNDPEFLKRFAGSYGFNSELEPKITTTNEMAFYRELALVLRDKPEEAAQRLSTNITAQSSAVLDYTYGTVLFQLGRTEEALKSYENAIAKFPGFLRAHKNQGFARVKAGQYGEAVKPLTRTIELGGADANIYGLLAFCYLNQEKYLAAESAYRNAVLLMPDNNDWKLGLIKAQIATGRYVEADRLIEELLAVNPNSDSLLSLQAGLYMQMDRPAKAGFNYEILRRMGKADLKMLMLLGDIYMTQNAKELALDVYLEAIAKDGVKDVSRSLRAADILVRSGAWSEAEQLFKRIRQQHGAKLAAEEDLKLLKLESRVAMAAGEGQKAAVALERIIDKNPLDGEALLLLGDYFARSNEKEKALFRYEMAAKIPEFEPDALVKQAQWNASQRKFERALELLRKAQKLKPRDNVQRYLEAVERVARSAASTSS